MPDISVKITHVPKKAIDNLPDLENVTITKEDTDYSISTENIDDSGKIMTQLEKQKSK